MSTSEIVGLKRESAIFLTPGIRTDRQMMTRERQNMEYQIRTYTGNDPLEPYYNYIIWLEKNCPNNVVPVLEDVLVKFKEIESYKQDPRLVFILVEYISNQENPSELYELAYSQGLGTSSSVFYKRWVEELDKIDDIKKADQVFQLGIKCRAQPEADLQNAHIQFQLNIARRVLDGNINIPRKTSNSATQTIPFKSLSTRVQSCRRDEELVGVRKLEIENENKFESGQKSDHLEDCEGEWFRNVQKTQSRPRHSERTNNADWLTRTSKFSCPVAIHEPPDPMKKPMYPKHLVYVDGLDLQLEEIRATHFRNKESIYQVAKPVNLTKLSSTSSETCRDMARTLPLTRSTLKQTFSDSDMSHNQNFGLETEFIQPVEPPHIPERPSVALQKCFSTVNSDVPKDQSWFLRTEFIQPVKTAQSSQVTTTHKLPSESYFSIESMNLKHKSKFLDLKETKATLTTQGEPPMEGKILDFSNYSSKSGSSALHHSPTASFTVNTQAAMNVIQKMWESPLAFRCAKVYQPQEEKNLFKLPATRTSEYFKMTNNDLSSPCMTFDARQTSDLPLHEVQKSANKLAFLVYCEEDDAIPLTSIRTRIPNRGGCPVPVAVEERLSSSMNVLEIDEERKHLVEAIRSPTKLVNTAQSLENKENDPPKIDLIVRDNQRQLDEVDGVRNELFDETCSTKAFAMLLPSSTPFAPSNRSRKPRNSSIFNRSYTEEDSNVFHPTKSLPVHGTNNASTVNPTNLSLILENSKEQGYSSSGGNVPKSFF